MKRLEGKVAVITGGNSGIGLAAAKRLQEEGARIAISGRNRKTLDEAAKALGREALVVQADVTDIGDAEKLFAAVAQRFGKIDVLFANAGLVRFIPFEKTTEREYDEQFDINTKGAYFTVQKALPHLNDGASIIFNTSVASHKGIVNGTVYAATKAALRSLTRSLAAELAPRKIRVNAVAPGPTETPIFERSGNSPEEIEQWKKRVLATIPLGRFGQPEEVAAVVAFLASPDASFVTAVEINVDGGRGQT